MTKVKSVNRLATGKATVKSNGIHTVTPGKPDMAKVEKALALSALTEAFKAHRTASDGLKVAMDIAIASGCTREECVEAGVKAGYSESWARQCVVQALDEAKPERKKKKTGRTTKADAHSLADYARERFKGNAGKMLLAAYRIVTGKTGKAAK